MPETHRDEIEKLEALYASNPTGRVFTHLAEAYRKAGDTARAREILDDGLARHSDYPSAYVVLGRVLVDVGETAEATAAFRRVLELDRHNLVALRALGDLAVEAGRFEDARHYFGELILIDPSDLETAERLETLPEDVAFADLSPEPEPESESEPEPGIESEPEPGIEPGAESGDVVRASEEAGQLVVEAAESVGPEAEAGASLPSATEEGEASPPEPAPLEAWVETLSVPDVDAELPVLPPMETAPPIGWPEPEATEATEVEEVALPDVELEIDDSGPEGWPEPDVELEPLEAASEAPGPELEPVVEIGAEELEIEAGELEIEAEELEIEAEVVEEPVAGVSDAILEPEEEVGPESAEMESGEPTVAEEDLAAVWWGDPELHASVPEPVEWVSQEDWDQIAASGAWTGAGDAEASLDAVPPVEGEWGSERDEDADEVATETLAEVYAAQGFRTEAATIYRKLLRRRPDDERLLSRLAALEKDPVEEPIEEAGEEVTPPEEPATGMWTDEADWPGSEAPVEAGPTPYAWLESGAPAETDDGGTIGERLRGILGWQPEPGSAGPETEPTLILEEVSAEPALPELPVYGVEALPDEEAGISRDAESEEDLEMFRTWLKSLRK